MSSCTFVPQSSGRPAASFLCADEPISLRINLWNSTPSPGRRRGTFGILAFPLDRGRVGASRGGSAVPSPEWDLEPANFFNDYSACTISTTSDCYRSEVIRPPLEAGQNDGGTTSVRTEKEARRERARGVHLRGCGRRAR